MLTLCSILVDDLDLLFFVNELLLLLLLLKLLAMASCCSCCSCCSSIDVSSCDGSFMLS